MNELARIVHDLVTGKSLCVDCLADLSPQERAAVQDLRVVLTNPQSRAENLGWAAQEWLRPPPATLTIAPRQRSVPST